MMRSISHDMREEAIKIASCLADAYHKLEKATNEAEQEKAEQEARTYHKRKKELISKFNATTKPGEARLKNFSACQGILIPVYETSTNNR